ncbi:hypothetical protein [Amycolatopsis magusensis]|uniref:hypothetical protein n=1 Tax=Amycolatopsis magusensis TaxID=882444 RepID=UPI00378DB042
MLSTTDLTDDEAWEALGVLGMCRDGCVYTTDEGYAVIDAGTAEKDPSCQQITDRLIDAHMVVQGRPEAVQLDDGTYTTAQLDITDAGRKLRDQLDTEFSGSRRGQHP